MKKFRVYDDKVKKFTYFDIRNGYGRLPLDIPDNQIQQSVGLKDKNGIDIYEGDIVQKHFKDGNTHGFCSFEVKWSSQHCGFCVSTGKNHYYLIIGNIFEGYTNTKNGIKIKKLKTIDEVCGRPPGSFQKSLENNRLKELEMEKAREKRIRNKKK